VEPLQYETLARTEADHWWFVGRRRIIDAVIARLGLPGEPKILEIGSGTGGNLEVLGKYGAVTGIEPEQGAVDACLEKNPNVRVIRGGLPDDLPVIDESSDLIALFDVLEHVADDAGGVVEVGKYLNTGGWVVVTVPAMPALWSRHDDILHHQRRYTRNALETLFAGPQYEIELCTHFNTLLLPLAIGTRLAGRLFGIDFPDQRTPHRVINELLLRIFSFERRLVGKVPLPIGLSLLLVARKT
jgi:SAM-dependent methyltransferase